MLGFEFPEGSSADSTANPAFVAAGAILHQVGLVLLGICSISFLISAYPYSLTDPTWLQKSINLLNALASTALVALVIIVIGRAFDEGSINQAQRTHLIRQAARWVAVAWLLLIPLQAWVGIQLVNSAKFSEAGQIDNLQKTLTLFRAVSNEAELREVFRRLPDVPPPVSPLDATVATYKQRIDESLSARIQALKQASVTAQADRLQQFLRKLLEGSLSSLLFAYGFYVASGRKLWFPWQQRGYGFEQGEDFIE